MTYPDGTTIGYQYQASYTPTSPTVFHALISMTDQNNNTTTYAYDSSGHQTSTTDPLGNVTSDAFPARVC